MVFVKASAMEIDTGDVEQNTNSTINLAGFIRGIADGLDDLNIGTSKQFVQEKFEKARKEDTTVYC